MEYLLGTTNRLDDVIVLGMITQMSHGTYHLGKIISKIITHLINNLLRGPQRGCKAQHDRGQVPHRPVH